jgi:ribosomal protein L11 methyltransferase
MELSTWRCVPYRVDLRDAGDHVFDRLVELGALDVESLSQNRMAALIPDNVTLAQVTRAVGIDDITVSPAVSRDNGSVWVLTPRPICVGSLRIVPAYLDAEPGALKLLDSSAFGTGLHPTTALCLEVLGEIVQTSQPKAVLDVGTGSGVLALGALLLGVPNASGIDVENNALRVAADNARLNGLDARLQLAHGGPESVTRMWPLVLANILAAPLIEMAPALVRCVGHRGQLVLSGIRSSLELEVAQAYVRLGMRRISARSRGGWVALVLQASW